MAKKPAKKSAKTMNKKQMTKTTGGFFAYTGGVTVAAGDVNGDVNGSISGNLTKSTLNGDGKVAPGSFTGGV